MDTTDMAMGPGTAGKVKDRTNSSQSRRMRVEEWWNRYWVEMGCYTDGGSLVSISTRSFVKSSHRKGVRLQFALFITPAWWVGKSLGEPQLCAMSVSMSGATNSRHANASRITSQRSSARVEELADAHHVRVFCPTLLSVPQALCTDALSLPAACSPCTGETLLKTRTREPDCPIPIQCLSLTTVRAWPRQPNDSTFQFLTCKTG